MAYESERKRYYERVPVRVPVKAPVKVLVKAPVEVPVKETLSTSSTKPVPKSYVSPTTPSATTESVVITKDTIATVRAERLVARGEVTNPSYSESQKLQFENELEQEKLVQIRGDELAEKKKLIEKGLVEYNAKKQEYDKLLNELSTISDVKLRKKKEQELVGLKNMMDTALLSYQKTITTPAPPLAPPGYHKMPDGSIMSDVEHAVLETLPKCNKYKEIGNIKRAKTAIIMGIDFDNSDINQGGETRNFRVSATNGSVFSLEIKSSAGKYYNFYSNSFTTTYANLNKTTVNGVFEFSVVFPSAGATTYDIFVLAEDGTVHAGYKEVLLDDNTVDLNSSTGSNSLLLQKQLRQSLDETLTYNLSAKSPNGVANLSDHASVTGSSFLKGRTSMIGRTSFEFSVTSGSTKAFQILKQPTFEDIFVEVTRTIGSAPAVIEGENIDSDTYYSWPLNNIDGLTEDMIPIGTNITADSVIKYYEEIVTSLPDTACEHKDLVNRVEPLTKTSPATITRNATTGMLETIQLGNVTFDKKQGRALIGDEIKFLAYGPEKIKELTGWEMELIDLKVELTKPTTTTTSASVNNVEIAIASGDGIVDDVSTVSGIGISGSGTSSPKVTTIAGYSGTTATITVDSAQTLESGTTLTFHGGGETITISGSITFTTAGKSFGTNYEMPGWDGKFYFDLEKFITPTAEAS